MLPGDTCHEDRLYQSAEDPREHHVVPWLNGKHPGRMSGINTLEPNIKIALAIRPTVNKLMADICVTAKDANAAIIQPGTFLGQILRSRGQVRCLQHHCHVIKDDIIDKPFARFTLIKEPLPLQVEVFRKNVLTRCLAFTHANEGKSSLQSASTVFLLDRECIQFSIREALRRGIEEIYIVMKTSE